MPPQDFETIRGIVESELGCKIEEVFKSFEEEPIGAASIGQVHFAALKNGRKVVVKVQVRLCESDAAFSCAVSYVASRVRRSSIPRLRNISRWTLTPSSGSSRG